MPDSGRRWRRTSGVLLVLLSLPGRDADAWVTLSEKGESTIELETRVMIWAVREGREVALPAGTPSQDESVLDFMIRRARILLRAQVSPRLEFYVQLGQDNVDSRISADEAGFRIKDAYLNYKRADSFQVMVGQFKVPFLRQSLQSGFNQLLADRAVLPSLKPAGEGTRDAGGMVWGNAAGLQYRAAIFDGSDQEDSTSRSSLRGTARLSWNWFTRETGAGYSGTTIGETRVLQIATQMDAQGDRVDSKDDAAFTNEPRTYRAHAFDVFYDQPFAGRWALTFEGACLDRRDDYDNPSLATRTISGYYAQAGLLLPRSGPSGRFQITARYEDLDANRGTTTSSNRNRTVGLNWYAKGHERKIQLDWTQRSEAPAPLDNDEVRLSMVASW